MDSRAELSKLEHQLELANRAARLVLDEPAKVRIREFAQDIESKIAGLQELEVEEAIRARAHRLWREAGCPEGRDLEFWTLAERHIRERPVDLWECHPSPPDDGSMVAQNQH